MPNVVSGNIIAASLMIGETAAETIAAEHVSSSREFVGLATRQSALTSASATGDHVLGLCDEN